MKKTFKLLLVIAITASMILSGCAKSEKVENPPTVKAGGTVTISQEGEPGNLNPLIWATTSDTNVSNLIFDTLVRPNDKLELEPDLAKSWTISPDGKIYTFELNDNIKWHDGVAFTAKDVAFTFNSLANPQYDAGAYSRVEPILGAKEFHEGKADSVSGIKVISDNKIEFTLVEPNASFLANLCIGIVPEHILKDVSPTEWAKHESNRKPIGTGPFKFVKWEPGQYIEVEANKDYFSGAPKLDKIVYRFGDANTMIAAFMSKEIDIVPVPVSEVESIKTLDFADVKTSNDLSVYYIGFNLRNPMFKDVKVRQAFAYAVNKELIVSSVIGEFGEVCDDLFPNAHWSHNPDVTKYPYDKNKAKQLLEEAGYKTNANGIYEKDGKELKFTLEVPTGKKEREKTAVMLKQQWEEIGIKCEIIQLDFPTLVTKLLPKSKDGKQREVTAEDFDAYILGFGIEVDPDEYRPYFNSVYMPPNGYNFCGYSNPAMDALLEKQIKQIDAKERQATFFEIGKILSDEQPWIPIYGQKSVFAANINIEGFNPDFRGVTFNAKDWSLK